MLAARTGVARSLAQALPILTTGEGGSCRRSSSIRERSAYIGLDSGEFALTKDLR
jgi:hypothetical protein